MKSNYLRFYFLLPLTLSTLLFMSCEDGAKSEVQENYSITYSVEFPFIEDETLLKWFPTEYSAIFNDKELYGEMNSKMNVISNKFYSNADDLKIKQTLENMSGKYVSDLDKVDVDKMLNLMPKMKISEPLKDTVILGLNCKIALAEFLIDSVPPVKLYYTDDLTVNNPNWFNQYNELNSFLLGYEVEQFGMRMRLMAKDFKKTTDPIASTNVYGARKPASYNELSPADLRNEISEMVSDFME